MTPGSRSRRSEWRFNGNEFKARFVNTFAAKPTIDRFRKAGHDRNVPMIAR